MFLLLEAAGICTQCFNFIIFHPASSAYWHVLNRLLNLSLFVFIFLSLCRQRRRLVDEELREVMLCEACWDL